MVVAECPKIFGVQCIWGRMFLSLENIFVFKYSQTKFQSVFAWNIFGKNIRKICLGAFLRAPIPFKRYQNTSGCDTDRKRALTWNELTFIGNGLHLTVCLKISELFYRDMSINFFYFQKKNISIPWKCFSPSICQNVAIMKTTDWQLNHS